MALPTKGQLKGFKAAGLRCRRSLSPVLQTPPPLPECGPEFQTLRGLLGFLEVRIWAHWQSLSQAVEFITQFS